MASSRKSSLLNLTERLSISLGQLLPEGSSILLGLSGGVDSVVLLHLLNGLAPRFCWKISALHVHHGISRNADSWSEFCKLLCERYRIPLCIERVDIAPLRSHGIEAAARRLRHAAFEAQRCDFVALAHHADDQVETLFLQLLRGAGVKGASAMPVLSPPKISRHQLVRPLLQFTRDEILTYATEHRLEWVEDESNADERYPRNFLRHCLLPRLATQFPSYRETLTRSTRHFSEAANLLDDLARIDATGALNDSRLNVGVLQALNHPRAKNLLRYFFDQQGAPMPQAAKLDDMLQQLCSAREDAAVCIDFGGWQVRRHQGHVYVFRAFASFDVVQLWQGESILPWPALNASVAFQYTEGQGISLLKLQSAQVTLRQRQGGESLRTQSAGSTRTLKNLFQECGIPPWQRERLPLLYCGDHLVCVPGVAIAAAYQASGTEDAVSISLTQR
ncbi:MAG: tRNA lysidine(34) synthetase TilS [Gallionella sp.]|jgi:tRNA(Ile)-lysidine synthase|nr:tRNA lysidine(34) synthetase TilS [Gallionella sp.]